MQPLNCDKPYNLDEAAARRGAPRRRRKDSRTTAYELTIRIPEEHRRHFGGKKKLTRVVFALNKKVDLRGQVKAFEEEKNAALALALEREGGGGLDAAAWAAMPFGECGEVRRQARRRHLGGNGRERAALPGVRQGDHRGYPPEGARRGGRRALRARRAPALPGVGRGADEENRERLRREGRLKRRDPLKPPRVAGPAMQSKVLKFVREVLNDAVDREHVGRNVAKKRFLSKGFKKGRPLVDPLMEDEAGRFLEQASLLPLGMTKVAVLLLFSTGMRPEEMLALRVGTFVPAEDGGDAQVRIVAAQRAGRIEGYTKSDSSMRTVPVDRYTASVVEAWIEEKRRALDEMGLVLRSSTPLLGEAGNPWGYNSFKKRWNAFVRKAGFAGTRPYALRHTFATINLARGENIKTVSVLLGHADASYTLDLYVGFIPATTRGLANRYVGRLAPGLAGAGGGRGEE